MCALISNSLKQFNTEQQQVDSGGRDDVCKLAKVVCFVRFEFIGNSSYMALYYEVYVAGM